jgi:hypothetical protein
MVFKQGFLHADERAIYALKHKMAQYFTRDFTNIFFVKAFHIINHNNSLAL